MIYKSCIAWTVDYNSCPGEDFDLECPTEYNDTERIGHLLEANISCYQATLMVDKVPYNKIINHNSSIKNFKSATFIVTQKVEANYVTQKS